MALRTPDSGYNALRASISSSYGVKQAGISTRQGYDNLESVNKQFRSNIAGTVIEGVGQVTGLVGQIHGVAKDSQLESAKTDILGISTQNKQMIYESLANGTTYMDQDGKFVLDQNYVQWQQSQLDAIEMSDDMREVKQWKRSALLQTFDSSQGVLMEAAYNNYTAAYDTSFKNNLTLARHSDVAAGTFSNGAAIISSRSDWSPAQKQAAYESYQLSVKRDVDTRVISQLAAKEGIASATTAAYALEGYSPEEIQSMVATAAKTDQQLSTAAATTVSTVMADGLAAGRNPQDLYRDVEAAVENMPGDRKQKALEAARGAHVLWATDKAMAMYVGDSDADLGYLQERRDSIAKGPLSAEIFYNLPEVQDKFIGLYDNQIGAVQKVQGSVSDDLVKTNKTSSEAVYKQFTDGSISGKQAVSYLMKVGETTEGLEDDVYARDFIRKIQENLVPAKYKPTVDSYMKQMDSLNWGVGIDRDLFTPDQESQLAEAKLWAYGTVADLFMGTAANEITDKELSDALANVSRVYTSEILDTMGKVAIMDKTATSDMLESAYKMGTVKPVYFDDTTGQVKWASTEYRQAFDKVAGQFENEIESLGVKVTDPAHPLTMDGDVYAVPTVRGTEGDGVVRDYTVNRNEILSSDDGGITWIKRWAIKGTKFDDVTFLAGNPKRDMTGLNEELGGRVVDDKSQGMVSGATSKNDTKAQPTAQWADNRVGAYRDAMAKPAPKDPDTTPQEDAARMDRTNIAKQGDPDAKDAEAISTLSDRSQSLLRNVLRLWMNKNPGKVPKKSDVASQMGFIDEEHVEAMYRILSREEQ